MSGWTVEEMRQNEEDGAALRRLREVLPEGLWWFVLVYDEHDVPESPVHIYGGGPDDSTDEPAFGAWSSTIAEAAEKCRELVS